MVIPINIELKHYIKSYLLTLNPILRLKKREIELLEGMITIYLNLKKEVIAKRMTEDEVDKRMNEPIGRKIIADYVKMSRNSYNNHYLKLKEKNIITKDDRLPKILKINPLTPDMSITYKFNFVKAKESQPTTKPKEQTIQEATPLQSTIETTIA